jgi:hypothetical protein
LITESCGACQSCVPNKRLGWAQHSLLLVLWLLLGLLLFGNRLSFALCYPPTSPGVGEHAQRWSEQEGDGKKNIGGAV